jgi:integrase
MLVSAGGIQTDTNMLTDVTIRQAKPGHKARKLSDGHGLFLLIQPNGSKLWRQAYRFGGKQRLLAHGRYPDVSLADARNACDASRALLRKGADPSGQRKLSIAATFQHIAEEVVTKATKEGRMADTVARNCRILGIAYAAIGQRPISEITAPELLSVLRKVEAREQYETARRLRSLSSRVFRYAIATGRAERDPAADLRGALIAPITNHRAALTKPEQIGALMRAIDAYEGEQATRIALQLLALTFPRPSELRLAQWSEIDFDRAVWKLPAKRMKMRAPHAKPLSRQAIALLRELQTISPGGPYLFPSIRSIERPMSICTVNAALRRLGYTSEEMCGHGFRATASTLLNESGKWSADAIERELAHQDSNGVRAAYARGQHWEERVRMMGWWADYLDSLKQKRSAA